MNNDFESEWSAMEQRLNLQSIGEFIQTGGDAEIDKRGFTERLEKAHKDLYDYIKNACGDDTADDITENIIVYSSTLKDVYFSLGMKTGAKIIIQLTNNFESDF